MQTASHSHPQSVNDGYGLLRTYLCLARFYYLTGFHSFNPHNNALWRRLSHHNVHGFHSLGHRSLRCSNTLTWSPVTSTQTVCLSSPHPRCRSTLLCMRPHSLSGVTSPFYPLCRAPSQHSSSATELQSRKLLAFFTLLPQGVLKTGEVLQGHYQNPKRL